MNRWRRLAEQVASQLPEREGKRLLVGSCWHNRGYKFTNELDRAIRPDLFIAAGDLSGIGGSAERAVLASRWRVQSPTIFCGGNHDSPRTARQMERKGAIALHPSEIVEWGGVRVWGMSDPNRTKLSPTHSYPYDMKLVRDVATTIFPPLNVNPYLIVVHNAGLVKSVPGRVSLLISGHAHSFKVERHGHWTLARCGTSGGGGIGHDGRLQFLVIDLALPEHRPSKIWEIGATSEDVWVRESSDI